MQVCFVISAGGCVPEIVPEHHHQGRTSLWLCVCWPHFACSKVSISPAVMGQKTVIFSVFSATMIQKWVCNCSSRMSVCGCLCVARIDGSVCPLCLDPVPTEDWQSGKHRSQCGNRNTAKLSIYPPHPTVFCTTCGGKIRLWPAPTSGASGKFRCSSQVGLCATNENGQKIKNNGKNR